MLPAEQGLTWKERILFFPEGFEQSLKHIYMEDGGVQIHPNVSKDIS